MNFFYHIGRYFAFLAKCFGKPEKHSVWYRQMVKELQLLGVSSVGIVVIISVFIGAVITIQTAYNMDNPLFPDYLISLTTRDTMFLEFSSTIVALILAGKVGSNIASEVGTMRVTEQIDAIEIMGINSASYLMLPKIVAFLCFMPFLVIISMFVGIFGGYLASIITGVISGQSYVDGLQFAFVPYYILYALVKAQFYAFIIVTVAGYQGFFVSGGALDVGRSSTKAVVYGSVIVLLFDLLLTQILLS